MIKLPPLSLYIHIPWCIKKCYYCDFHSYTLKNELPEQKYITHLLNDLQNDIKLISDRKVNSIFIGGGTPSLFNEKTIQYLLYGINERLLLASNAEITIETNPSMVEINRFSKYKQVGINRISIGVQSFNTNKLIKLGRMHSSKESIHALSLVAGLNLHSFNIDLMHGLPNQSLNQAMFDLKKAINLLPPHISWYQLTIEPNTKFGYHKPILPNDKILWQIFSKGNKILRKSGYQQYEISSYAKSGHQSKHNLNYWRFGDYIGIGCGAHGKISFNNGRILRTIKTKHPYKYMNGNYIHQQKEVNQLDRPFEFFMNRFRLLEEIPKQDFINYTGLIENTIRNQLDNAIDQGYITETKLNWQITNKGTLFLNFLLMLFL
ncbi:MAG: radical SAM family heme chaperone HemW [Arsenophonus endosymbiont of Ceratovacuna japonica]